MHSVDPAAEASTPTAGGPRVIRWALDFALVILVTIVGIGVLLGRIVPLAGEHTYMITSGSMTPAIPVGAAVVVDPNAASIAVGDVVSVRLSGSHVYTHRVTRVIDRNGATWYETKGDANAEPDPAIVPASAVVGRVAATIPFAGYLLRLMSLPSGIVLLLGLGGMLVVASSFIEAPDGPAPERALASAGAISETARSSVESDQRSIANAHASQAHAE